MHTIYNRRNMIKWGFGGLAGLGAYSLASCSDSVPSLSNSGGPVALQLLFWGSVTRNKLTEQATNQFHKRYTSVMITSQYTKTFNDYWPRLDALTAASKTPDLLQMDMRYLAKYVRSNLMFDLTQLVYNQTIDLSDFDPVMLDNSKANNTIYGIPMGGNYQCLLYDATLIDRAGVGLPPDNMTWNTFAEYTSAISRAFGNRIYGTADSSGDMSVYEIWVRQRGKELYTTDGKLAFNVQDVADWFNYWSGLRSNHACITAALQEAFSITGGAANSTLIHGKSVFVLPHTNEFESYQALTQHSLALHFIPRGLGPGLYFKPSQLISISSKTPHVTEAANFINFIVNDPGGIKSIGMERGFPGALRAQELLQPGLTPVQQQEVAFTNAITASGNTRVKEVLDPPSASQVASLFTKVATNVCFNRISVTNGAKTFYAAAQKILA